jgi:hypothetical protein
MLQNHARIDENLFEAILWQAGEAYLQKLVLQI